MERKRMKSIPIGVFSDRGREILRRMNGSAIFFCSWSEQYSMRYNGTIPKEMNIPVVPFCIFLDAANHAYSLYQLSPTVTTVCLIYFLTSGIICTHFPFCRISLEHNRG